MSVQIYDSSDSDTSPLSTDEYDDDEDSDLMDMAVSVKPKPGVSNNNISTSKIGTSGTASSSSPNVKSSTKSGCGGDHKRTATRFKKTKMQPKRFHAICKKRSLRWFKNGMKRATVRLCLKEFYLNRIQKNGENIMVAASIKSSSSAAGAGGAAAAEEKKVSTDAILTLEGEIRYDQQLFVQQQQQRGLNENLKEQNQNQFTLNEQQQQKKKQEQRERSMIEIFKHLKSQERLQNKSPELICLDVTEDEESPQKSEPSPPSTPITKVDKMQLKIVDVTASIDDIVICPDEEDVVEVNTKINYERTSPIIETTDLDTYQQDIPLLNYGSQTIVTEVKNVTATDVVINRSNNDEAQFLVTASALSNINIPGIMEVDTVIDADIIPMQMKTSVEAEPTPTTVEVVAEQQPEQKMSFKLTSTSSSSFSNSATILPHSPQVVTPMAHTPSPIRAPQTTATPQVAHMRSPIVVPSTHKKSVVTSSTPVPTSITLPPPQMHASNMSVKRRRSTTPENNKLPTATTSQPDTSKQGQESSSLPGNTENTDGNQQQAPKKRMLDPTSNAAFYQRIIDLIPDYEEAISTHIQGSTQTEEKLYEAIRRTNNDLAVLDNVLATKEDEWNKLLYLRRVQEELLSRMVRMIGVIKAKKRGEMVHKYSLKQLQELEESLKINIASSQPELQTHKPPEREKPETEHEPCVSVNKMAQMINRLENMLPEDIREHAMKVKDLKEKLCPNDKSHERWSNNNDASTSRLMSELISKEEERHIKRQREDEMRRKYVDSKIQEEHRVAYENQLRYEKQRQIEHQRQLKECYGKYPDGVPDEFLTNKVKAEAELQSRYQPQQPPHTMVGRQGSNNDIKGIIDNFRRENPQALPPPPLFKCTKPVKPETYVSNNNNYANNYKPSSSISPYDNVPTLKTLLSSGGGGGGGVVQPRSSLEQFEHSGSGMAPMPKPCRPKFDMRFNNTSYDANLRASSSNPYKNTNRHSYGGLEYNRNNYGISNGGQLNHAMDQDMDVCQGCYKNEAMFVCGNCNEGRYCSRKCQLFAWDKHQDVCGE